jgi:hypothetical protein
MERTGTGNSLVVNLEAFGGKHPKSLWDITSSASFSDNFTTIVVGL